MTNVKGDQPAGIWAVTGHDAEAGAASAAKGVRYNEGQIQMAGEGAPGPLAQGIASSTRTASGGVSATAVPAQAATFEFMHSSRCKHDHAAHRTE